MWILAGNDTFFPIAAGFIKRPMPEASNFVCNEGYRVALYPQTIYLYHSSEIQWPIGVEINSIYVHR